jgi:copper(I)-binding protein
LALRPVDNVGVQYGLGALNAGKITARQFLNLNAGIGGYDQDANYVSARTSADAVAVKRTYQSGLSLGGSGGLASIPVFDFGSYNEGGGYHYQWFHFALRARLIEANGSADNHVMWRGSQVARDAAASVFDAWVTAYKSDRSNRPQLEKVIRHKPAAAVDGCWASASEFIAEPQTFSSQPNSRCNQLFPSYAAPRLVAGGPLAGNVLKCELKPIDVKDYSVKFTPAEMAQLRSIFANGVCDWMKRGVNQAGVVPWASFGPSPDNLVFDLTRENQEPPLVDIQVTDAWIRWLPANLPGGGYLTLTNRGAATHVLIGAQSPDYGEIGIHQTRLSNGVSEMAAVASIDLKPAMSIRFGASGYHLMLMRPLHTIAPGDRVSIVLRFKDGSLSVPFTVRAGNGVEK